MQRQVHTLDLPQVSSRPEPDHFGLTRVQLQPSGGAPSVYFLYTLLQSLDGSTDLDNSDAIDQLRVVRVKMATQITE